MIRRIVLVLISISVFGGLYCHSTQLIQSPGRSVVGPHYELFRFEKSENTQNILVIYSRLDEHCRFYTEGGNSEKPIFDFYWLMNQQNYKPVHRIIKSNIRHRLHVEVPNDFAVKRNYFSVRVTDLKTIAPSVQNNLISVLARRVDRECEVSASFSFEEKQKLKLQKIYLESRKTLWPPFRKVVSLRFEGTNEKTGLYEQKVFTEKN